MKQVIDKELKTNTIPTNERTNERTNELSVGEYQISFADLVAERRGVYVRQIEYDEAKPFIKKIHYARRMPSVTHAFGLFKDGQLIGCVTYGIPPSPNLCEGLAGEKNRYNVYELNRLVILPEYNGKNYASILVGRSLKMMPHRSFIVSYADTGWGHVGYVYQATNWLYTGMSAKRTDFYIEGKHPRSAYRKGGKITETTLHQTRNAKHRYVYLVGNKRERKEMRAELRYKVLKDYPKGETHHYDVNNPKIVHPIEIIGSTEDSN